MQRVHPLNLKSKYCSTELTNRQSNEGAVKDHSSQFFIRCWFEWKPLIPSKIPINLHFVSFGMLDVPFMTSLNCHSFHARMLEFPRRAALYFSRPNEFEFFWWQQWYPFMRLVHGLMAALCVVCCLWFIADWLCSDCPFAFIVFGRRIHIWGFRSEMFNEIRIS